MLTLLGDLTPQEFKLPLSRLMAANYDPLVIVGLQVANDRAEQLHVDSLLKLASSTNERVAILAVQSFGYSATLEDVPRLESVGAKSKNQAIKSEVSLSIKKIQFRDQLATAKRLGQPTENIIKTSLADSTMSNFVWQHAVEPDVLKNAHAHTNLSTNFTVKPFAQNLLPAKVTHFVSIPKPREAVEKLYESLRGIQMDSPRAQSSVFLALHGLRQLLGQQLGAPIETESLFDHTGIAPDSPIVLSEWTADGTTSNAPSASRKAIILRVKDRRRFERSIEFVQSATGDVATLTDVIAVGSRGMAAIPALLPFLAKEVASITSKKPDSNLPMLRYSVVGETALNDLQIKTIQHNSLDPNWNIIKATTYVVLAGDTVILAPNLASIREVLSRANSPSASDKLSESEDFKQIVETNDDVIYFSDIKSAIASTGPGVSDEALKIKESGALRITESSWENSHRLVFNESDWSKQLYPFHPKELVAPGELLPASTVGYYLMKIDVAKAWNEWSKELLGQAAVDSVNSVWAMDFKQEVATELGPECGVALLTIPDINSRDFTWTTFCKLKTTKLADALAAGKLFRGIGPSVDTAEIKIDNASYFVTSKSGFLVFSNRKEGLASLTQKDKLATTRDYSRAASKVPNQIVAFGGYNLEAAVQAVRKSLQEGSNARLAEVIFSIASAFHSQNFYANATPGAIEGKSSVAMDREGRYSVAELKYLPRGKNITFATLEPRGIPILDQKRISTLILKVKSKSTGPIDNIREGIKTHDQTIEQKNANELLLTVAARREAPDQKLQLPIADASVNEFLKPTGEFSSDDKDVIEQARKIAGDDKDAWSVARKLGDWTFKNLTWKAVATANASQTLATREADCSEFSQLYVSMARSLGLPARLVSGLAYSSSSFGGHAWVEVWIGRWIELDPTWGTDFVDATHIRETSNALITSAALNLIDVEVLEAKRGVADFQKDPHTLAKELSVAFGSRGKSSLEAALDLGLVTDEFMGPGEWERMTKDERNQLSFGYRRAIFELLFSNFDKESEETDEEQKQTYRLVDVQVNGDSATALCVTPEDLLLKVRLIKRQDSWHLLEVVQTDSGFHIVEESLKPIVHSIKEARSGRKTKAVAGSSFTRGLLLSNTNPNKALEITEAALKETPSSQDLRFLKTRLLLKLEKRDEAIKLLTELSNEQAPYAPAIYNLANLLEFSEKPDERKTAFELFKKYVAIEPTDPRGHASLARGFAAEKNLGEAEKEYRQALKYDPDFSDRYSDLIYFLIDNDRIDQVGAIFALAEQRPLAEVDLLSSMLEYMWYEDEFDKAEKLAASQPARMKTNAPANTWLAHSRIADGKALEALPLLNVAIQLDKESIEPHLAMADAYRALSRWLLALKSANNAVAIDAKNGQAHYLRACALAQLGRSAEAMSALNTAIELEPYRKMFLDAEKDLKPLARLPSFRKLLREAEKERTKSPTTPE